MGWFGLRYAAHTYADFKAHEITFLIDKELKTPDEKIKFITKRVSETFEHVDPSTVTALKFRSYVTNRRLPEFMRWKEGTIETIVNKGLCDNAARQLSYVLLREGFDSTQWNMMTPKGGHSALLVTLPDGRKVLTDPLFGLSAVDRAGQLVSPEKAWNRIQSGEKIETVFEALTDQSNYKFYKAYEKVSMAPQGESLMINISVPSYKNELILGKLNNDSRDVKNEGNALNMGPYLHYVGHQYDPKWVRVLKAEKDMTVEVFAVEGIHLKVKKKS
jgi:hypothetical protein